MALPASAVIAKDLGPYLPIALEDGVDPRNSTATPDLLAAAWTEVGEDLAQRGIVADRVTSSDPLRRCHILKACVLLGDTWGPDWADWVTRRDTQYRAAIDAALGTPGWYDANANGTQEATETPLASIRLTR